MRLLATTQKGMTMKAILVQMTDDGMVASTFDENTLIPAMTARGYEHSGYSRNEPPRRVELRGKPTFRGVAGPMYGGEDTPLRYEDVASYNVLST